MERLFKATRGGSPRHWLENAHSREDALKQARCRVPASEALRVSVEEVCRPHGRPLAWDHAVGCAECCRLAAEDADPSMAPNGGFWA